MPIVKHSFMIQHPNWSSRAPIHEAFHVARSAGVPDRWSWTFRQT